MSRKVLVSLLHTIEVALVGLFLVQALRRLPGLLFNQAFAAGQVGAMEAEGAGLAAENVNSGQFGSGIAVLALMLLLPLLAHRFARAREALPLCVSFLALARALPALGIDFPETWASAAVLGAGMACVVLLLQRRVMHFPQLMLFGFAADLLVRAGGNTLDISWTAAWDGVQLLLSAALVAVTVLLARRFQEPVLAEVTAQQGLITVRGAVGIGALLFLQLALLATPNAIAARSGAPLALVTPLILAATLLPLLPIVRMIARNLLQAFYGGIRGWLWMAITALLLVIGLRLEDLPAALALVLLQFAVSLMWWWLIRPQEEEDQNLSGVALLPALLVTALLLVLDLYTVAMPSPGANGYLLQGMLTGLQGMEAVIMLLAVVLTSLTMTRNRHRVAWARETAGNSPWNYLLVIAAVVLGIAFVRAPDLPTQQIGSTLRVASWNINAGADRFLQRDLEQTAQTILASGADVVMLQNVDAGRSASYWVDQAHWLARRLGMQQHFFPTAGGINGLALLARTNLQDAGGWLAVGDGRQGGLQRATIEVSDETLTLYNYWPGQAPRKLELQIGAMNTLIGALHNQQEPALLALAASFTGAPDDQLLLPLRAADFLDPFEALPGEIQWTTSAGEEQWRTDYLWYRSPLASNGAGALTANAQGHRLIVVELSLAAAAA